MTEITVGELLLECLQAEGIEMMFGIIDGSHIPFVAHTPRYGIRHIVSAVGAQFTSLGT